MPPESADYACLWDMLDAAKAVREFVAGKKFHDYLNDRMLRGAVERHLEIIGEAARRVSKRFQEAHPEIAWKPIIAQRHILAHEYGDIKHELIWKVVTVHIPGLIEKLHRLMPSPPSGQTT
jgi:uncharacterized protein with HEPN domain